MKHWLKDQHFRSLLKNSSYLAISREKSALVNLSSEQVIGGLAMVGTEVQLSKARLAVEYDVSRVNSLSLKVGVGR